MISDWEIGRGCVALLLNITFYVVTVAVKRLKGAIF